MILYDVYDSDKMPKPLEWTTDRVCKKCIVVYSRRHWKNKIKKEYYAKDLKEIAQILCDINGIKKQVACLMFNDDIAMCQHLFLLCLNKPKERYSRIVHLRYYKNLINGESYATMEMEGVPFEDWMHCYIKFKPEKKRKKYEISQ